MTANIYKNLYKSLKKNKFHATKYINMCKKSKVL